jgi:Fe-S oxidoreductase
MSPVAESYWGISGYIIFWILSVIALGIFVLRLRFLLRLLKLGRPENLFNRLPQRFLKASALFFSQSTNLKSFTFKDPAALGHSVMLWGLIIFGIAYIIFIGLGAGFGINSVISGRAFETVFNSILDIVALLVILAMLWVIVKRYLIVPERLKREQDTAEKVIQPLLITVVIALMVLHFGIEAFRYAAYGIPESGPLLGKPLAQALLNSGISPDTSATAFKGLWWLNYVLLLVGFVYAAYSKHLHPLTSFANLLFRSTRLKGSLRSIDLTMKETYGVARIQDFTWKQLLDLYACTWCGRCHVVCPAQLSGKPLSPRELILGMKEHLLEVGTALVKAKTSVSPEVVGNVISNEKGLIGDVITEDAIWSCTTCRACQEVCPVSIEHIDKIIDIRRYIQMVSTTEVARDTLKNLRVRGNPWRGTTYARTDWAEGMDIKIAGEDNNIDILFWVGCTEALEDRSLKVARAVAGIMKQAGVDFGILGEEEMCCGDPARRLGAEHLFQMLVTNNIQLLKSYNIRKIVTACPHCYNTLKNEYPQFSGQFEVLHHTQFIAGLLKEGKLEFNPAVKAVITYHEPCYLGRYNDIYEEPRQIIESMHGLTLVEMKQNRENGFCCGGGGGRMWLEEKIGRRISEICLEQATDTRAQVITTACPFCLQMLEDAVKAKEVEKPVTVKDVAELVADSLVAK